MTISSRLDGFAEGWSVDEPQRRAFVDLSLGSRWLHCSSHGSNRVRLRREVVVVVAETETEIVEKLRQAAHPVRRRVKRLIQIQMEDSVS
jgi:hypothetical protein